MNHSKPRLLAISSAGGHWIQLGRLRPAMEDCQVFFASSCPEYRETATVTSLKAGYYNFPEASRWSKSKLLWQAFRIAFIVLSVRPDVVVTTGASCGYFAIRISKLLFRSKAIWVDSLANVDSPSLAGEKSAKYCNLCLTQWEQVADGRVFQFRGSVL